MPVDLEEWKWGDSGGVNHTISENKSFYVESRPRLSEKAEGAVAIEVGT